MEELRLNYSAEKNGLYLYKIPMFYEFKKVAGIYFVCDDLSRIELDLDLNFNFDDYGQDAYITQVFANFNKTIICEYS